MFCISEGLSYSIRYVIGGGTFLFIFVGVIAVFIKFRDKQIQHRTRRRRAIPSVHPVTSHPVQRKPAALKTKTQPAPTEPKKEKSAQLPVSLPPVTSHSDPYHPPPPWKYTVTLFCSVSNTESTEGISERNHCAVNSCAVPADFYRFVSVFFFLNVTPQITRTLSYKSEYETIISWKYRDHCVYQVLVS